MREASAHGRGRMGAGEVACDAKVGPLVAVLRLVLSASSVYCSQIPMYGIVPTVPVYCCLAAMCSVRLLRLLWAFRTRTRMSGLCDLSHVCQSLCQNPCLIDHRIV